MKNFRLIEPVSFQQPFYKNRLTYFFSTVH